MNSDHPRTRASTRFKSDKVLLGNVHKTKGSKSRWQIMVEGQRYGGMVATKRAAPSFLLPIPYAAWTMGYWPLVHL